MPLSDAPTTSTDQGAVARVVDLSVTFRRDNHDVHALRGISLDFRPGEILGLVGESGSGKSVLGSALLGLLPGDPDVRGAVFVRDVDMAHSSAKQRREVRRLDLGAVFQDPMTSLDPTMRIGRQMLEATGDDEESIRLLTAAGIPEPRRRMASFPHELSGGLRQRVMIAAALAGNPSLLVADEPTTALDVTVQAQVLALLQSLRDTLGCSIILVTHDLGVASQVADRIAVMYAGRLAELGPTAEILERASHPYTLSLMRSRLTLDVDRSRRLLALDGEPVNPAAPPPGCAFAGRCPLAIAECSYNPPPPMLEEAPLHGRACVREPAHVRTEFRGMAGEGAALLPLDRTRRRGDAPLEVRAVSKTFAVRDGRGRRARLQALRDISLAVAPGETVAIVGESGSGKSTLLRVVAGLEQADHGSVSLGSERTPQMVFQDAGASLTPWLTVEELIGERLLSTKLSRADRADRVRRTLESVGLPAGVGRARAGQLSGGQRQRVSLARAVIVPPSILLCDEPTSALDVSLAATVINLIRDVRTAIGMSILFVTHDLAVARVVADRIAVMYLGRIVEIGDADAIIRDPKHPYTRTLLASLPGIGRPPTALQGEPASPLAPPSGCSFHPRCPFATAACSAPQLDVPLLAAGSDRSAACIRLGEI